MANAEARSLVERTLKEYGSAQAAIEEFERRDHVRLSWASNPATAAKPRQHAVVRPFQTLINPTACGRRQERAEKGPKLAVPEVVPGAVQPGFSSAAYVAYAGPGLLVAAAYVDPGSIEAALASGTFFGEANLLSTLPLL
jgi:hypothetical protein